MKKITAVFLVFISVLFLTSCNANSKYLKEITLSNLYKMVENKESFILELSQDGCSHCASFNPVFTNILEKYEITAYYINISKISEDEFNQFIKDFNNNKSLGTPTVMFFKNGNEKTEMNRIVGEAKEKEIIRKLKQNDYIDEQ